MNKYDLIRSKILDKSSAAVLAKHWKESGLRIVFTNGCFDIIHLGHIDYLSRASDLGDKFIIGLNTDNSIRRIKGNSRPVQDQYARSMILASMLFVDAIVLFDEDTPLNLIEFLLPDVLVKGSDYDIKQIIGADVVIANGGSVETIDFVDGYSTSSIINKLQKD